MGYGEIRTPTLWLEKLVFRWLLLALAAIYLVTTATRIPMFFILLSEALKLSLTLKSIGKMSCSIA